MVWGFWTLGCTNKWTPLPYLVTCIKPMSLGVLSPKTPILKPKSLVWWWWGGKMIGSWGAIFKRNEHSSSRTRLVPTRLSPTVYTVPLLHKAISSPSLSLSQSQTDAGTPCYSNRKQTKAACRLHICGLCFQHTLDYLGHAECERALWTSPSSLVACSAAGLHYRLPHPFCNSPQLPYSCFVPPLSHKPSNLSGVNHSTYSDYARHCGEYRNVPSFWISQQGYKSFWFDPGKENKGRIFSGAYFDPVGVSPKMMKNLSRITQGQELGIHQGGFCFIEQSNYSLSLLGRSGPPHVLNPHAGI